MTAPAHPANGTPPPAADRPLSPRTRALVIGLRAAALLIADVLGAFAGLPGRTSGERETGVR